MAESNPIAKAYVQIVPTTKKIATNIAKSMGDEGEKGGKNFVSGMMGTIAKIGIGVKVLDAIKTGLNLGAELEQNLGGTEAVFGQFAKNIQTTAQDAYKNMGLSASDYMATANKMGSLFQGSGVEQEKALQLTSQAMQRAADVASVMGLDTSAAMESIAGAAKGNFTMINNNLSVA